MPHGMMQPSSGEGTPTSTGTDPHTVALTNPTCTVLSFWTQKYVYLRMALVDPTPARLGLKSVYVRVQQRASQVVASLTFMILHDAAPLKDSIK
jgi:hypothetical protein